MALMYRAVIAPDDQPVTDRPSVPDPNAFDNKLSVAGGAIRGSAIDEHRFNPPVLYERRNNSTRAVPTDDVDSFIANRFG